MEFVEIIAEIETQAKRRHIRIDDLCVAIDTGRAPWQRWKKGRAAPLVTRWQELVPRLKEMGFRVPPLY